jgi:hypothetical protein
LRRRLEAELARVEADLLAAKDEETAAKLRERRLLLSVALVDLGRDESARPPSYQRLLARAAADLDRVRTAEREQVMREMRDLERQRAAADMKQAEREVLAREEAERVSEKRRRQRMADRTGKGCAPGDPLCGDLQPAPPADDGPRASGEGSRDGRGKDDYGRADKRPIVGAARVAHEEAPRGVLEAIERRASAIRACLGPDERAGRVRVRVRVDGEGAFREPRIVEGSLSGSAQACIAEHFRAMRLAEAPGVSRVVTVPLELAP